MATGSAIGRVTPQAYAFGLVGLAAVLSVALAGSAHAKNCGTGAGALNIDVACDCGDTVVTKTRLNRAFDTVAANACAGSGLSVGPAMTLNLGGETIAGTLGEGSVGVTVGAGATVENGEVKSFETGTVAAGGGRISGIRVTASVTGISVSGQGNRVEESQVTGN